MNNTTTYTAPIAVEFEKLNGQIVLAVGFLEIKNGKLVIKKIY